MESKKQQNWIMKAGAILILIGALSIFPENGTWIHTALQITFIVGCIVFIIGGRWVKKGKNSTVAAALILFATLPISGAAQDYSQQVKAFEESFHQKDISVIQPFLSDSLKFNPLPIQNTLPVLGNIVTQLPSLNGIEILNAEKGKVKVNYDFEQLGKSESYIHFDTKGKIKRIEFVDNLIKQQMDQQRKMQSSVQAPQPDMIDFTYSKKKVEFPSKDGLIISADLYEVDPDLPVVVLFHQAGYNKYEYADIAPRLNKIGFNALAIDQRAGGSFAGKQNETNNRAMHNGIENIEFLDAMQDMESAIDYLADRYQKKVIVWGSSYSSGLALHIATQNKKVKAVISFSPGDYFGKSFPSLKTVLPKIEQPFLVTSSREEADELTKLLSEVDQSDLRSQYIPESEGFHGSKALWIDQDGAEEYWAAVTSFLDKITQN
jgi:dienelactone hydrolase